MSEHVFRGTTAECLKHYGGAIKNSGSEGATARAPMAMFTGANERTVRDWLLGCVPPVGKFIVKARYFLAEQRYAVSELEQLDPLVRELGWLIAHGTISFNEAVEVLGVPGDSYLLRILHGRIASMARASWVDAARKLVEERRDRIPAERGRPAAVPAKGAAAPPASSGRFSEREIVLNTLATLITAAQPLAELVLSDKFTTQDRQALRTRTGGDGIYGFANMMDRLCSEMARGQIAPYAGRAAGRSSTSREEKA